MYRLCVDLRAHRITKPFCRLIDAAYFLDPTTCRAIMNHYVLSNERVRQHWFPQRDTLFLPLPDESYAPLDLTRGLVRAKRFLREYFPASLQAATIYLTQALELASNLA